MTCPQCGHDNQPEAGFCAICGTPLIAQADQDGEPRPFPSDQAPDRIPPRDVSELVGETFDVYRTSFWPFFIIALAPEVPLVVPSVVPDFATVFLGLLFFLIALFLTPDAMVYAVAQHYTVGRINVTECFRRAWYRVLSLFFSFFMVSFVLVLCILLSVLVIGIPMFFYFLVVLFFAPEAIMIEGDGPLAALVRSEELVRGSWWRVFAIGLVFVLVLIGLFVLGAIAASIVSLVGPIVGDLASIAVLALIIPVVNIGRTLVYLDLRARKDDYSVAELATEIRRP